MVGRLLNRVSMHAVWPTGLRERFYNMDDHFCIAVTWVAPYPSDSLHGRRLKGVDTTLS